MPTCEMCGDVFSYCIEIVVDKEILQRLNRSLFKDQKMYFCLNCAFKYKDRTPFSKGCILKVLDTHDLCTYYVEALNSNELICIVDESKVKSLKKDFEWLYPQVQVLSYQKVEVMKNDRKTFREKHPNGFVKPDEVAYLVKYNY